VSEHKRDKGKERGGGRFLIRKNGFRVENLGGEAKKPRE